MHVRETHAHGHGLARRSAKTARDSKARAPMMIPISPARMSFMPVGTSLIYAASLTGASLPDVRRRIAFSVHDTRA